MSFQVSQRRWLGGRQSLHLTLVILWLLAPTVRTFSSSRRHACLSAPAFVSSRHIGVTVYSSVLGMSLSTDEEAFVEADDLEALQTLFAKYCDEEGLMSQSGAMNVAAIADLLAEGDLLPEEFVDIWQKAPKFPDDSDRVDVDSFVQIYRDIDDLFEEDDDEPTASPINVASDSQDSVEEAELEVVFADLCDDTGMISKDVLRWWEEVQALIEDSLLGEDEFDALWEKTTRSDDRLDLQGFLSFNAALDELFDFEDDDMMDDNEEDDVIPEATPEAVASSDDASAEKLVEQGDMLPAQLFAALAMDGAVTLKELQRWSDLEDMLAEGDLLSSELESMYNSIVDDDNDALNEAGFVKLYNMIDDLFEDNEESSATTPTTTISHTKEDLLDVLTELNNPIEEEALPCGLDATEREQRIVLDLVNRLEQEPSNIIRLRQGAVEPVDLAGTWELLYTSSSAMKFNKGLSGLGGSFPNGRFAGVKQTLKASKFLSDVEYTERIEVNPSSASFDVKVTGDWDLRSSVSLFTGEPSIVLQVTPDRVEYGPTSTRADHWKSLGPMNMLDIVYLDENLRVMRGNTSVETVFVLRRCD